MLPFGVSMITKVDIPLPPKPDDGLSEPEFTSLVFTDACTVSAIPGCSCTRVTLWSGNLLMCELQGCGAEPAKAYPELHKRICEGCAATR